MSVKFALRRHSRHRVILGIPVHAVSEVVNKMGFIQCIA